MNTRTHTEGESAAFGGWQPVLLPCFPPFCGAIVESHAAGRDGVLLSMWLVFKKEKQNQESDLVHNYKCGFFACSEGAVQTEEAKYIV